MTITMTTESMLQYIAQGANLVDYVDDFTELGGGELNDTFLLHCETRDIVVRISRHAGRDELRREARALKLLENIGNIPELIFFDEHKRVNDRAFIVESYQSGQCVERLSLRQFQALGALLAEIHKVQSDNVCPDPWSMIVSNCHRFGDESYLLNHPDVRLRRQFQSLKEKAAIVNANSKPQSLRHCDITPSNTLVDGENVSLIDWELSGFGDPMTDFSTGYWSDMELNNGKWRQQLSDEERQALYDGYAIGGGIIDEHLVLFYEMVDKIGVAAYLYWRLHVSDWQANDGMSEQYAIDYEKILLSLTTFQG